MYKGAGKNIYKTECFIQFTQDKSSHMALKS